MRKKRLLVLVLSAVMLVGGAVSVLAISYTDNDEIHDFPVYYEIMCDSTSGNASTRIYGDGYAYTRAQVGVTLTVMNRTTGAISDYGSAVDEVDDYADATVSISNTDKYIGYRASSTHHATVTKNGDEQMHERYLVLYN